MKRQTIPMSRGSDSVQATNAGPAWRRLLAVVVLLVSALPLRAAESLAALTEYAPSQYRIEYSRAIGNRRTGDYAITLTVTNISGQAFPATVAYVAFEDIAPAALRLTNHDALSTEGVPYFQVDAAGFGPGSQFSVRPNFANAGRLQVSFRPRIYFRPPNTPPVADAGRDSSASTAEPVILDGTSSYDPDQDLLHFQWSPSSRPSGSTAALDDATLPRPRFTPDLPGDYGFDLIVNDGQRASPADSVVVSARDAPAAPNAHAGRPQRVRLGDRVRLNGSASTDPDDLPLTFAWGFHALPPASRLNNTGIESASDAVAWFTPDVSGTYGLTLTVGNGVLADSDAQSVEVRDLEVPPTADAGPDLSVKPGVVANLDGSASHDPDSGPAPLAHRWSLVAKPAGSTIDSSHIADANQAAAHFTPDQEGTYVARLEVDDGQSRDGDNTAVTADATAPTIQVTAPADGSSIADPRPALAIAFQDAASGIDTDSFQLLINGADVTGAARVAGDGASYTPGADLPFGDNRIVARISDRAGNAAEASIHFTVFVFRAIADCGPTTGTPPHTVTYRSRGQFTGGSIVRYRWDRDGNGSYDTSDSVPADYSSTFNSAGTYRAVLEVLNNLGETATDTCTIQVVRQGPTATATAAPSNGPVPLGVTLGCQGQTTNGSITRWEWDFDGDGTYDYSATGSGTIAHTYTTVGEFAARCRVTDSAGLTGVSGAINTTVRPRPEGSPSVTATASPATGNAPLNVTLGGSVVGGAAIVRYEWDFDGDGTYDSSSTASPAASHGYTAAGVFGATLRVTDALGQTSADSIAIEVNVTAGLAIPTDTFQPDIGQTAAVRTTLSGTVPVRLYIRDKTGNPVRTLIARTRAAGTYDDPWDGRNDAGRLLPDGDYYAVLEYDIGGQTKRVDLTDTTGGTRYNPTRGSLPTTFDPYNNNLLPITFTIPSNQGASEVLAFVGLFNTDTRLVTLLDREPLGVGTHTIYWDGLLPDGSLAVPPPGDSFLFGIWGYRLPDNAIYINTAPTLASVAVAPTQFNPLSVSNPAATIAFILDKPATVELAVRNLETGRVLRRISQYVNPLATATTIYHDDFESGVGLWTHGGSQDEWELGAPTYGPGSASSGLNAWGTDLDSSYNNSADEWLLSPPISLTKPANLTFWQYIGSESFFDGGIVELSTDNGASFTRITPNAGYPYSGVRFGGNAYSGELGTSQQSFDLGAYIGQTIRIRFRFITDGSVTSSGWYIDDFTIKQGDSISWDGKTDDGLYADKGEYRLELRATDASGGSSLVRYTLVRVFY